MVFIAEQNAMMNIVVAMWNFWVNGILIPLGGSAIQSIAISVTAVMVIMGVLVYLLLDQLVLKRFVEDDAIRKWPSIIISVAFVFVMLFSGSIVVIASMMTLATLLIAFVVTAVLFYYIFAIGAKGYSGAHAIQSSAYKDYAESAGTMKEAKDSIREVQEEELKTRREKESLNRWDKVKNPIASGKLAQAKKGNINTLILRLQQLRQMATTGATGIANPEKARIINANCIRIYERLLGLERYTIRADAYGEALGKAAGLLKPGEFDKTHKDIDTRIKKVEKATTDLENRIKGSKDTRLKSLKPDLDNLKFRFAAAKKNYDNAVNDVKKKSTFFDDAQKKYIKEIDKIRTIEQKHIVPFQTVGALLEQIGNGIQNGDNRVVRDNASQALKILSVLSKISTVKGQRSEEFYENEMKKALGDVERDTHNILLNIRAIETDVVQLDRDLTAVEKEEKVAPKPGQKANVPGAPKGKPPKKGISPFAHVP